MNKENQIELSLIIPVYNGEKVVGRCIESLWKQLSDDIELLIVDDGSVDKTRLVLEKYISNRNITVIYNEHGGVGRARNSGLLAAAGKYISFIDSDDFVGENYIETLMRTMRDDSDIIVFNEWFRIDENGRLYTDSKGISIRGDCSAKELYPYLITQNLNNVCAKIFRRSIIEQNRIQFDETMLISEDFMFVMEYLEHCKDAKVWESISYYYEYNSNGTCQNRSQYLDDLVKSYDKIAEFAEKNLLMLDCYDWDRQCMHSRYLRQLCGVLTGLHEICSLTEENMDALKRTRLYQDITKEKYDKLKYRIMKYFLLKEQWNILGQLFKMKGSK